MCICLYFHCVFEIIIQLSVEIKMYFKLYFEFKRNFRRLSRLCYGPYKPLIPCHLIRWERRFILWIEVRLLALCRRHSLVEKGPVNAAKRKITQDWFSLRTCFFMNFELCIAGWGCFKYICVVLSCKCSKCK